MLEHAFRGTKIYYGWVTALLAVIGVGFGFYLWQLSFGLGITGMSRDVSWGFYIAQFTFLVGVAASAVMVVLPYYLHDYKAFGRITILGEFLAVASVTMCLLFILVDLGQPMRALNVILYPTPRSILFWDMIVLNGYLVLNIVIGWKILESERHAVAAPLLGEAADLPFDPVGRQHPHGDRISLLRAPGEGILAHRDSRPALSRFRLCGRAGVSHPPLPPHPESDPVRSGKRTDPESRENRDIRHHPERLLFSL
jgi:hypothetical protein